MDSKDSSQEFFAAIAPTSKASRLVPGVMVARSFILFAVMSGIAACGGSDTDVSFTAAPAEDSDDVTYDPSTCKTDAEGMVYFALGRDVFRRPYEQGMTIRGMSDEERASLPPRPDPTEPEGCPGNPIWGRNFSIGYQHQAENPGAYPPDTPFRGQIYQSHRNI